MLRASAALLISSSRVPLVSFLNAQFQLHGRSRCLVSEILQDHTKLPSTRNPFSVVRTYCATQDLSTKKCCDSNDLRPMTEEAANELIQKVHGWSLVNEGDTLKLNRYWKVKSFKKGLEFFQIVADIAEAEGHHPDLHLVNWNDVKIEIWTHSIGGLTENDFILASKISALDLHHLLRKTSN
ncbi:hypothetical protein Sjap_026461 [Stephania japonica]|uniref:4a-hydroxytetrahydrobiopterin dehydratase n=1 Tax=Stephania japonica TaxID=461633 RepID=A0AAP0E3K5_9MAGN